MARLKQLPDGMWIDPETVVMIESQEGFRSRDPRGGHYGYPGRVVVSFRDGKWRDIECEVGEAGAMRDRIAAMVNGAEEA